ncbi:ankyrin [Karstenula rhodostoma CBS 690.94]|uniref:Ankyrin n=1 Tax=Karstenula rhodostoma CBS 690.94 TaxID=1392251 RepID=A0A9P4UDD3_9PLEO|nr:ankyrin [Karstenula rhodostoma CBS 690.94]
MSSRCPRNYVAPNNSPHITSSSLTLLTKCKSSPTEDYPLNLMDLPLEIFRIILAEAVRLRGVKRALRLRLVNKLFSDELVEVLCVSRVLRTYHLEPSEWAYVRPYVESRLLARQTKDFPALHNIRKAAEVLASQHGAPSGYEEYALKLLHVATTGSDFTTVRSPLFQRDWDLHERMFECDLLSAAAFANNIPLVESLVDKKLSVDRGTFGNPFLVATLAGNYEALAALRAADEEKQSHLLSRPRLIELLSGAVFKGDIAMVRHIFRTSPDFLMQWRRNNKWFQQHKMPKNPVSWPKRSICSDLLYTPSVNVFKLIGKAVEKREILLVNREVMLAVLVNAIRRGWMEMAKHLIRNEAPLDRPYSRVTGESENALYFACMYGRDDMFRLLCDNGAQICGSELGIAAWHGHTSIIKMLLERGADIHATTSRNSLYAAARKGYLSVTRVLLDAGMDPNTGDTPPLFGAVESEHVGIFRLLVERGAVVSSITLEDRNKAETEGLESMLALLSEYGASEPTEVLR